LLADLFAEARELSVRTMIFDVEPLVAPWHGSQESLDQGIARILGDVGTIPSVRVVVFAGTGWRPARARAHASLGQAGAPGAVPPARQRPAARRRCGSGSPRATRAPPRQRVSASRADFSSSQAEVSWKSTLDPDRAAAVMRMSADTAYPNGPQLATEGTVSVRKDRNLRAMQQALGGAELEVEGWLGARDLAA
jgi:hypothetical protein